MLSPFKRVIVLDSAQRVKGIISDVDVLARIQEKARPGFLHLLTNWARGKPARISTGLLHPPAGKARVAADIMNEAVMTVTENTAVQEMIERMMTTGRKVLPVVDEQNHLKEVIGRSDLLRILIEEG